MLTMLEAMEVEGGSRSNTGAAIAYTTNHGVMIHGTIEEALSSELIFNSRGKVSLIFTSPPFPLNRQKTYGNLTGAQYLEWLGTLSPLLVELLAPNGSIVIELGNCWEPGQPIMSTLPLRALLEFQEKGSLNLCQQFIAHNPSRLPGPAQWVTIKRSRVKDSYTHLWWMAPSTEPKADNRRVLLEYSDSMKQLLSRRSYNRGKRPSGHDIVGDSFLKDNGGAIPPNVLTYANTRSRDAYTEYCQDNDFPIHPARMAPKVAEFFIKLLTEEGDLVLDPFAGSNTTGATAERNRRRWIAVEADIQYVEGSKGRFLPLLNDASELKKHSNGDTQRADPSTLSSLERH